MTTAELNQILDGIVDRHPAEFSVVARVKTELLYRMRSALMVERALHDAIKIIEKGDARK